MTTIFRRVLRGLPAAATRPVAVGIVLAFVAAAGSGVASFSREPARALSPDDPARGASPQDPRAEFERYWASLPRVTVPVPSAGAAVLIVKFTDFQCPQCATTYKEYKPILAKYDAAIPGAVKLVSKMYPLQPECNPNITRPFHSAACDAAAAWLMARARGRADAMEDWLYANQGMFSPAFVRDGARTVGLIPDFAAQYPRVLEEIKAEVSLALMLNVTATPTFFLNGVRIDGPLRMPQYFDMAIAAELKRAGRIR